MPGGDWGLNMAQDQKATLPTLVVASPFCLLIGFVFLISKNMAGAIIFLMLGLSFGAVAGTKAVSSAKSPADETAAGAGGDRPNQSL